MQFERLLSLIPPSLNNISGEVFYSGRGAFTQTTRVYLLGLNPGSDATDMTLNTVEESARQTHLAHPELFSRYIDERWKRRTNRFSPMQLRIQHLAAKVGLDLRSVPASNLVFTRSVEAKDIRLRLKDLADLCWPMHEEVIRSLGVNVVLCLGTDATRYVRQKLNATQRCASFRETNCRGWQSHAYRSPSGVKVVQLTHPGRTNWVAADADPSVLVKEVLSLAIGHSDRS